MYQELCFKQRFKDIYLTMYSSFELLRYIQMRHVVHVPNAAIVHPTFGIPRLLLSLLRYCKSMQKQY